MSDNYVILIDENGQPYIAHSIFSNARQKGAKYIEKIKDGAKTRYFYTKAELDAYYNKGKQKVQETAKKAKATVKDKLGYDEREDRDNAIKNYRKTLQRYKNAKQDEKLARSKSIYRDSNGNDWYSNEIDARRASDTELNATRLKNQSRYDAKSIKYFQDRYNKTPLGRLENTKNIIKAGVKEIKSFAQDKISDIDNFLNPKLPKPKLSSPNDKVETEHIIEETIIPEKVIKENRIEETIIPERKIIEKKPNPRNSSGVISRDTLKEDAKEAGLDFSNYDNASRNLEKVTKELMREYREKQNSPGPKSLASRMFYDDPRYKKALEAKDKAEKELTDQLYF